MLSAHKELKEMLYVAPRLWRVEIVDVTTAAVKTGNAVGEERRRKQCRAVLGTDQHNAVRQLPVHIYVQRLGRKAVALAS